PKRPDSPFSVCTARKTSFTSSASVPPRRHTSSSARRSRERPSTISWASEKNSSRALSPASPPRPPPPPPPCSAIASCEELLARAAQELGRERLRHVGIGAELLAALDVALRGLRGDDDERRAPVGLRPADEVDELEPVHVGHVDVRDDEVVARPRQEPHRVESALRLGDLDRADRAGERRVLQ